MLNEGRLREGLDAVLESAIGRTVVGTVLIVQHAGQPAYVRAAGHADREAELAMHTDTLFRLASITKPITTVAALRLIEAGKLALDAPVTQFLPEFRPQLPDGSTPEITIQHLLTHTSGLSYVHQQPTDGSYMRAGVSDGLDTPGLPLDEELRRIVSAGLSYAPGTSWGYSLAIDVLGAVLERVTGRGLPDVLAELVTEPLHMRSTSFRPGPLATPYADGKPPLRMGEPERVPFLGLAGLSMSPARAFDPRSFASGGAGMNGTANDVVTLLEAVRQGGVLSPAMTREVLRNQVGDFPTAFGPGWGFGYGGAILVDPQAGRTPQSPGTWTWGGVWGHAWFVDPARELTVVGLTNTALEGMMGRFTIDVRNAVYRAFA